MMKALQIMSVHKLYTLLCKLSDERGGMDFKKAKSYWTTLKNRLKDEGSELVTKCDQLKMMAQVQS